MKKIFIILVSILAIASCKEKNGNSALTQTFKSDTLHFSIQYPKDWVVLQNPNDMNSVAFIENLQDAQDTYKENIVCWAEEMPIEIPDSTYYQATITQLKISNPNINVQKGPKVKLGGNNFSTFNFDYTRNDSLHYFVQAYCIVKGKTGYNFSCTATKASMSRHEGIFKQILSTFKPL